MDENEQRNCITEVAKELGIKIKSLCRKPLSNTWHIEAFGSYDQVRFTPKPNATKEEYIQQIKSLFGFEDISRPAFVEEQIVNLRLRSPDTVYGAMQWLQKVGETALPPLIKSLMDKNEPTFFRARVADTLALIGNPMAITSLIETLNDPEVEIRWHAVQALAAIGNESAISPLEKLAASERGRFSITPTLHVNVRNDAQKAIREIKQRKNDSLKK